MGGRSLRWSAAASGWAVAALSGVVIGLILRVLYGLAVGVPVERGGFTSSTVVIALVAGFEAYLVGGYAAGRLAGVSGGLNGAMAAVIGLFTGVVLAVVLSRFGMLFVEGVAMPPSCFGLGAKALLAALVLFLFNLFGGYVGGKMGEPSPGTKEDSHKRPPSR